MDPKINHEKESFTPMENLNEVQIEPQDFQTTKLGTYLTETEEE